MEISKIVKFIETESRIVVSRGSGEGKMKSYSPMGVKFQVSKMNKFSRSFVQFYAYSQQ